MVDGEFEGGGGGGKKQKEQEELQSHVEVGQWTFREGR